MTIKQVTIKNVVNGSHIFRTTKYRKRQMRRRNSLLAGARLKALRARDFVQIHGEKLQTLARPTLIQPREGLQVFLATPRLVRPKVEQDRFAALSSHGASLAGRVWQRKVRR
jgi:hypothetical protein